MRKVISVLILIECTIIMVGATNKVAANERPYSFFVAGNLGFAVSPDPFNSYYLMGFGAAGGIEYPISSKWSFIGMIDYMKFSPDRGTIEGWWTDPGEYPNFINIDPREGGVTATSFSILSKGALKSEGSRIYPYVKGGFGLTIGSVSQIHMYFDNLYTGRRDSMWVSVEGTDTNISIILGVGIEMKLGKGNSTLFADAGIHMIMIEDINPTVVPIMVGIRF